MPTFQKGYLWGEDLSGSLQGAGGLLSEKRGGQTYLPVYDGNDNIMNYLNTSTRAPVAEYVYDAFGRTISSNGAEAVSITTVTVTTIRSTAAGLAVIRSKKTAA